MLVVGIDEVGRGCWAGPLVAGAVVLHQPLIVGLKDSKQLSRKRREQLDIEIRRQALAYGLGWVDSEELDALGLTQAVRVAMERALQAITCQYDAVIIDGNLNYLAHYPHTECLIKADAIVPAVSAASIIAKVARDNYMIEAALTYPGYGFEKHVGYGTAAHAAALQRLNACRIHRRSFRPIQLLTERA